MIFSFPFFGSIAIITTTCNRKSIGSKQANKAAAATDITRSSLVSQV